MQDDKVMGILEHANKWLVGEIYEDMAIVVAGIVFLLLSILAWRFGTSESARAMVVPLLVAAVLIVGLGAGLAYNNHNRMEQFAQQYDEAPQQFLESEKTRVDSFMKIYPQTVIAASVMMTIGVCVFAFCSGPSLRASALVLVLVALTALTIDFFSKERAIIYQNAINSIQIVETQASMGEISSMDR